MCVPHGPEAATGNMIIVDPEMGYHAACKDEYRHKFISIFIIFWQSVEPMFVEVSVAFVEPRGQYHNF